MKKIFLVLFLMLGFIGYYIFNVFSQYSEFKNSSVELTDKVSIEIVKGTNWKKVGTLLEEKKLIKDKSYFGQSFFYILVKQTGSGKLLKTGEYEFKGSIKPSEIISTISKGKVKLYSFTVPEGFNKFDTAALLKKITWITGSENFLTLCDDRKFVNSLGWRTAPTCEGLLFPSTYKFSKNVSIEKVMTKMADEMHSVLNKFSDKIKNYKLNKYDILKIASIIEKETGAKEEQPKIASVFLNRMRIGMPLQSDPTVIYGLLPNFNGNITKKNLQTDHAHSTYTRRKLPVTPIAFPGEGAIQGLLNPEKTNLLYFVSTRKGFHYFSKTLKEHNAAVDWYILKRNKTPFKWVKN